MNAEQNYFAMRDTAKLDLERRQFAAEHGLYYEEVELVTIGKGYFFHVKRPA